MTRVADLDVKDEAWRDTVMTVIARNTVRGVPRPEGLPENGYLKIRAQRNRLRVSYEIERRRSITLGSVADSHREQVRREWLAENPITLESGMRVIVTFDDGNPDLPRPWPVELFRRPTLQGAQ